MSPPATCGAPPPMLSTSNTHPPHVLIVGGGIGGLTLSILLERAKIPYTILERSTHVRLLGSAIALGPGVLPLFEQLGLLEEIQKHSRPVARGVVWSEKLIPIMDLDHTSTRKRYGHLTRVIARPKLYQILLSRVPAGKMHMNKKVVSLQQDCPNLAPAQQQQQYPVMVSCADGSQYWGDILVGADGAHSITRRLIYQQIEDDYAVASTSAGISDTSAKTHTMPLPLMSTSATSGAPIIVEPLPASDKEKLQFTSTCLVGQTRSGLDISKFRFVNGPECKVGSIIGDHKPFSWSVFSMPDDSICWMVTEHLVEALPSTPALTAESSSHCVTPIPPPSPPLSLVSSSSSSGSFLDSEWGPDKVDIMCEQVKQFPIPCGPSLTIGDLINHTDKEKISKVMLEEKLFETWSYKRIVLLGDACHKMHPSAGLGAVAAIQDAAVLSDLLYHLPTNASLRDITKVFESYREDRYPIAQQSYETSYQMSNLTEQSWISNFIRKVMNNLPKWIWYRVLDRLYEYRPQVSFLPRVEDHGEVPPLPLSYYYPGQNIIRKI